MKSGLLPWRTKRGVHSTGAAVVDDGRRQVEDFFYDGTYKGIQARHASKLKAILDRLDAANDIKDMNYPGSDLHLLQPKKKGRWALKISGNRRFTFEFKDGDAFNVDIEDYH